MVVGELTSRFGDKKTCERLAYLWAMGSRGLDLPGYYWDTALKAQRATKALPRWIAGVQQEFDAEVSQE